MANIESVQRFPIVSASENIIVNNGSDGTFICNSANPFDAATLASLLGGYRFGHAFKLLADGSDPIIATITTNGVLGASLVGTWPNGFGIGAEVEAMTMTSGTALIILKKVNLPLT